MHPFLRRLLEYWGVSLCHLHPNSILAIAIFINFCESYLGIYPHIHLFRYFYLKKKGGGGSKITGGVYLNLRDGMKAEYLNLPFGTSIKEWYKKWLYVS